MTNSLSNDMNRLADLIASEALEEAVLDLFMDGFKTPTRRKKSAQEYRGETTPRSRRSGGRSRGGRSGRSPVGGRSGSKGRGRS